VDNKIDLVAAPSMGHALAAALVRIRLGISDEA
jgi:hypothetical protein